MTAIREETLSRLRAFADAPPVSAAEQEEALRYVLEVCPDFAFAGMRTSRTAALTLPDGSAKQLSGRTHGDLLGQAAALITGKQSEREERRGKR